MHHNYLLVVTTFPTREAADSVAADVVRDRLAACAQVSEGSIASTYRWEGEIQMNAEWTCTFKTRRDRYPALEAAIKSRHTYQVPEILCYAVDGGSADYFAWIDESLSG